MALMVTALDKGSTSPGSSADCSHCIVFSLPRYI